MDGLPPPPELSSDIQRALQQAVGQANNAFISHQVADQSMPTKRKRTREKPPAAGVEVVNQKKRKKRIAEVVHTFPQGSPFLSAVDQPGAQSKKRKKALSKQSTQVTTEVSDINELPVSSSDISSQSQSPTAFLNAIVAAATATAAPPGHSSNFSHACFDVPSSSSYPYSTGASGPPPNAAAFQPPVSFSTVAVPDLEYSSNEDILRALQDLDVTKIATVLKTLGEAAAAANIPVTSLSSIITQRPLPIPTTSSNPVATTERPTRLASQHNRHSANESSQQGPLAHSDHADLLATKWLSANKLAELARTQGLVYKKGKFSAIEEQQIAGAIEAYKGVNQIDEAGFLGLVFDKNGAGKNNAFWSAITAAVPMRPIIAVYHHVRRTYHPLRAQGKWMRSEDESLKAAVQELGQQWEKVSERVGRMASDCRDRYRNHIHNSEDRAVGTWTKDEEIRLTEIVTEMTVKQGKDMDNDVFWGIVSQKMGNKRGRQQCRIKWTDALSKTFKNNGTKPRWSSRDAYILVHKVDSLNVRDDSEIDWKTLSDPNWNLWSAHTLQRRWLTMKRSVRGYEDMTHAEILDILRLKKLHSSSSRLRAVVSAEAVEDSDDMDDDGD
ncbi:hypothetical protein EDB87DRAFT_1605825 [Lactarius vividus]|nr:hypothetical protein EDB87DRAFT_1605825 [Lactarius vividus]